MKLVLKGKSPIVVINSTTNDDWIKSLPGHSDEVDVIDASATVGVEKKGIRLVKGHDKEAET